MVCILQILSDASCLRSEKSKRILSSRAHAFIVRTSNKGGRRQEIYSADRGLQRLLSREKLPPTCGTNAAAEWSAKMARHKEFRGRLDGKMERMKLVPSLSVLCRATLELTGAGMIASSRAFAEEIDRYYSFGELQRLECHCKVRSPLDSGKY